VQSSRGPRIANDTPARSSTSTTARDRLRAVVERAGAPDPVQVLGGALALGDDAHARAVGPVRAASLRHTPRVRRRFEVAQQRSGLGGEAGLGHHEVAPQVDDRVDVLDVDRALLHAGPARRARPHDLVVDDVGHERRRLDFGADLAGVEEPRSLVEQVVAQVHHEELRRQRLPGVPRRARRLAPPALGARVEVERLLPREIDDRGGPERHVLGLHALEVDAQRREPPARLRAPEEHVDRARRDVQVLRIAEVHAEREDQRHVGPQPGPHPRADPSRRGALEDPGDGRGHRGPPPVRREPERDPRAAAQEQRDDDPEDQSEDPVRLAPVAADEPLGPLAEPDRERDRQAHEHPGGEDVLHEPEPPGPADPRQLEPGIHDLPADLEDRGQQHEEAPEDQGVHQAGHEPLEQLALAEHPRAFAREPDREVAAALHGPPEPDEARQQPGPAGREAAGDGDHPGEQGCAGEHQGRSIAQFGLAGTKLTASGLTVMRSTSIMALD
jgi:hypothetical protein